MRHITAFYGLLQRRRWHPTPVLLPERSHGRRSLVGCSPWGLEESDMTERLHFHFSLSCIGEGNGNPLQCSCLENPRDRGAWWAPVYGVAQSRTRLRRLSSSSSKEIKAIKTLPEMPGGKHVAAGAPSPRDALSCRTLGLGSGGEDPAPVRGPSRSPTQGL